MANSVGGFLPGDVLLKDQGATPEQIATHPHPFYTPIATFGEEYALQPVAYGLKFAGLLSGSTFYKADLSAELQTAGIDASAYGAKLPGGHASVIVLNKDAASDLDLTLDFGAASGKVEIETLHGPALDSREARIEKSGKMENLPNGRCRITVPRASGIRLTVA